MQELKEDLKLYKKIYKQKRVSSRISKFFMIIELAKQ